MNALASPPQKNSNAASHGSTRQIELIRATIAPFRHLPPTKDEITIGEAVTFWPDRGPPVLGFVAATVYQDGKNWHFLVLADGNATCVRSTPISDERITELKKNLAESETV